MKLSITSVCAAALVSSQAALAQKSVPGYESYSSNETVPNFGQHYAVLNLDLINGLIKPIANTSQGECFINSMSQWINAVHAQKPAPLSIFTRIYFTNSKKPELGYGVPFAQVGAALGNSSDPNTFLYPAFTPIPDYDVILQKNRYYAGSGNELELILASERIDTVILSGIRTSGVILSTAYRLFDVNYKVYVISDNVIESPPDTAGINRAILEGIIPKLPATVITLKEALAGLKNSGPAIYYGPFPAA